MRRVPGQDDTAGLEAAVALTDDPEFLERVESERRATPAD